ncbi:LOW QUALITY PROTEIN: hypothetical protein AQUCO_08300097v1 [Aquilegia coerulea]|uniref:DYW domain-containing protein n=1 Tax=Aquilegia coerulea TaxID=218851 RepID=A0A2G5C7D5_AQUCA|nr:LOW QUALITY PROTEIN: hypothetical protein AQUCO_08300097v1 [Aquilegia coerulea]
MDEKDLVSWSSAIACLVDNGFNNEALELFREMQLSTSIRPDEVTMVDLPRRAVLLGQAYEFIDKMSIGANSVVWRTLLGACVNHGNLDLAKQVKEKLSMLDPYHDGDYVLLSNVYGRVNRWDDKAEMRSSMRKQRIEKKSGCSFIEVNWVIHEFVSGDNSHPEYETKCIEFNHAESQRLRQVGYAPDTNNVLFDVDEEEKEKNLSYHSEKMAVAFSLLVDNDRTTIRVMKNLRICTDYHRFMKYVSKVFHKEIIIRDRSRDPCSCRDYW